MRRYSKNIFFKTEAIVGTGLGVLLRYAGVFGNPIYVRICRLAWTLPDRTYATLDPFVMATGAALFARPQRPVYVERSFSYGVSMRFDLTEKTQRYLFSQKRYENALSSFLLRYLTQGDCVIDVGANVGYFTLLAAQKVGREGRVFAFEPEQNNYAALNKNVARNDMSHVHTYPYAIGAAHEEARSLYINPLNWGGNSMHPFDMYKTGEKYVMPEQIKRVFGEAVLEQKVPMRTLDEMWKEYGALTVDFLKIDVEGFEYDVLQGARALLSSGRLRTVMCEMGNRSTRPQIFSLLESCGYAPHALTFDGELVNAQERVSGARDIIFLLP
jgi:FkbM family methyltransferase